MGDRRFVVELIKPSHYDDDGYVIQWWKSWIPSNSLACLYGIATDLAERARPYFGRIEAIEDPVEALSRARSLDEPLLVTGSLYLLADLAKDESVRWRTLATG